jgi:hypothetical protein
MKTIKERFKSRLGPKDPVTGCIEWTGAKNPNGYGLIGRGRRTEGLVKAHRLAYELKHGPIPEGMGVLHECDNPPCCNPDHLFLGTQTDNNADMDAKGRRSLPPTLKGEENGSAKLSSAQVVEIKRFLSLGKHQRVIALAFGVSQATINNINTGRNWTHVD